jgi:SHS2 domain-containing protein
MVSKPAGFREVDHTADWELKVWAPDLPALLEQAALGMYSLTATLLESEPRMAREVELKAQDPEELLVAFLKELLFLGEIENLAFDVFDLRLNGNSLFARLEGAPLKSQAKEIKAVTYHNLAIRRTEKGLVVNIVFDV